MLKILIAFLVLFAGNGHSHDQEAFYLQYKITPGTKPGMGNKGTTITIDGRKVHYFQNYPEHIDENFVLSDLDQKKLIDYIKHSNFFARKDFNDDHCLDGIVESLHIQMGEMQKEVHLYYCINPGLIADMVKELDQVIKIGDRF